MDLESEVNDELKSEVLSQSTIVQQVRKDLSLALGQVEIEPKNSAKRETKFIPPRCKNPNCSQSWLCPGGEATTQCQIRINELEEAQRSGGLPVLSQRERATALRTGFRRSSTSR